VLAGVAIASVPNRREGRAIFVVSFRMPNRNSDAWPCYASAFSDFLSMNFDGNPA
jgi:hypothetical protein